MLGLIFGIIFLIAGIVGAAIMCNVVSTEYSNGNRTTVKPLKPFAWAPVIAGIILAAILTFLGCMATIPTGHTGIITTFGKVEDRTFDAGFNLKAPWQQVKKMDNRVQKANTTLSCFSSDIQEVTISYTLNYQIDKSNAQELYRTVGSSYYDTVVVPSIAESVKVVTARYTAEQLVGSRDELAAAIEQVLSDSLAKYNIQISSAAIEDMDFTDAFTTAVEAKQVAAQNKLQAEIEQAQMVMQKEADAKMAIIQANADAETAKIQAQVNAEAAKIKAETEAENAKIKAEADLEVVKIEADGVEYAGEKEASANKAVADSITEDLLKYYYIQNWDGKLPSTYVGSDDVSMIITGGQVTN